jgi:hypothetical protein
MNKELPDVSTIRDLLRITEAPSESRTRNYVVVRLEDCDGEETRIAVNGGRNYAVGVIDGDGVIDLIDWSYRSAEEARATWAEVDGKPRIEVQGWKEGEPWTSETARRRIGGTIGT